MLTQKRTFFLGLLLALATLVFDQFSKWWIVGMILTPARPQIDLLPVFNLALVWNTGISFGMFAAHDHRLILIGASALILFILLMWLYKNTSPLVACALGMVIGGATGNVIDRVRFGAVADFFDFHIGTYHWPAFNIADSSIFIGVVLLFMSSMFSGRDQKTKGSSS